MPADDILCIGLLEVDTQGPHTTLPTKYLQYSDVFSKDKSTQLPPHRPYDCAIELEDGATPPFGPLYRLSQAENEALRVHVEENRALGFVRPSSSSAGAPVLFVKKKDGTLRLVVDYRGINRITRKNRYPLPLIDSLLDQMSGRVIFTKLDLRGAYNLVRVKSGDEWKTAFRTPYGLFEYTVMPFGLTNAPATFQAFMNDIFKDFLDIFVIVYLDDILIFSTNQTEHNKHVSLVLQRLQDHQLFCKLEKCAFDQPKVEFLGYIITAEGISMDPTKVTTILDWAPPKKLKEVQSFLGFTNFYRRFITNYSSTVIPLTNLTKKDTPFQWTKDCSQAFEALKKAFSTTPVVAHVQPDQHFTLETDASDFALGAVLSQRNPTTNALHPVAFHSRKFSPAEINYDVHDKELLAIIDAFKVWRQYVISTNTPVTVYTDHRNLQFFMTSKTLNRRQARWASFLADFSFVIVYRPGTQQGKTDALSRRAEFSLQPSDPAVQQQYQTLLTSAHFQIAALTFAIPTDDDLRTAISTALPADPFYISILSSLSTNPNFTLHDSFLFHQHQLYVPEGACRTKILQLCHDSPMAGHYGVAKTIELLKRQFWWPKLYPSIRAFIASCPTCSRAKSNRHKPYGLLMPLPVPDRPWGSVSLDFITDLPMDSNYDAILVIVDRLTKMAHFIPTTKTCTAQQASQLFLDHIVRLHGLPDDIVSDRGSVFMSGFWQGLFTLLGVKHNASTAFHPESDGQTERVNQVLEQYLRCFISYQQDNWVSLLPTAEFSYNNTHHESTKTSPFMALYGVNPRFTTVTPAVPVNRAAEDRIADLLENQRLLKTELLTSQQKYKLAADRHRQPPPDFKIGEQVWLLRRHIHTTRPSSKLDYRKLGPFTIIQQINPVAFKLELPSHFRIHPVFHTSLLEKFTAPTEPDRFLPPPPPVEVDGTPEYVVEEILDSFVKRKKLYYRIRWSGYDISEDSVVTVNELFHCPELLQAFHDKYPHKPYQKIKLKVKPPRQQKKR